MPDASPKKPLRLSAKRIQTRREEILNACAELYEQMSFREITLKEIGQRTTFTRTSIYNYFHSREEIFLALTRREYEAWAADLDALRAKAGGGPHRFPAALGRTLDARTRLLKLLAMNLYDMEDNARMEHLVAFKTAYNGAIQALRQCLAAYFPAMTEGDVEDFLYLFLPFMFGLYPYTTVTDKQKEAMRLAGVSYPSLTAGALACAFTQKLLAPWLA